MRKIKNNLFCIINEKTDSDDGVSFFLDCEDFIVSSQYRR